MPRRQRKVKGAKRVAYQLIDRESKVGQPIYAMLQTIIEEHHEDLADAHIALAWALGWKADRDGRMKLGMCRKASDLDRELSAHDFVILIHRPFWYREEVNDHQRRALLDHELSHAAVSYDERSGEPVYDERGRKVYRTRKHDLEEFTSIVDRYGCYKSDIQSFYAALRRSDPATFKPCERCADSPGWVAGGDGVTVERCQCWLKWRERQEDAVPAAAKQGRLQPEAAAV